jgi:putative hemolysin
MRTIPPQAVDPPIGVNPRYRSLHPIQMMSSSSAGPFRIRFVDPDTLPKRLANRFAPLLESVLSFPALNRIHKKASRPHSSGRFSESALDALDIRLNARPEDVARIPQTGPLVVVANHPFGGPDGLALLALLQRRRLDVKMLANPLLRIIPELRDDIIQVNPFESRASIPRNGRAVRQAMRWVREGHVLALFPSGEVSSFNSKQRCVSDRPWSALAARMIRSTGAPVLPIFFAGRNTGLFQLAGFVHERLRTLMLPWQLLKRQGSRIDVEVGNLILPAPLVEIGDDGELAAYLQARTYLLGGRTISHTPERAVPAPESVAPIARAPATGDLRAEVSALPPTAKLASAGSVSVFIATYSMIPQIIQEIGRLREITFRAVGEGSGLERDLDRFDPTYLHLFAWDEDKQLIVGAYRLGLTDSLLSLGGKKALYTSTLFEFEDELLRQITPAIELGRSFVRREYQKEYAPLMLLWRGIAVFVARNPQYRRLFGPVSISNNYHSMTKEILIEFLKRNSYDRDIQRLVRPFNPPKFGVGRHWPARLAGAIVQTIGEIDELVQEIESDRKGIPVLLRQYLKLNAKLLGFNVDPDFGEVLDGLMLVDLTTVDRAILVRYMGRENSERFLKCHELRG